MLLFIVVISDDIQLVLLRASTTVQTCSVCRVIEDSEK